MKKSVYREEHGQWAWSVTISDSVLQCGAGCESYHDADEAADEATRMALRDEAAADVAHNMRLMEEALSRLSKPARQVVTKQRSLADASTVREIAVAYERGIFDYRVLKRTPSIMGKADIEVFLRERMPVST